MPCRDWGDPPPKDSFAIDARARKLQQDKLDLVTRVACSALKRIEESGQIWTQPKESQDWWIEHKLQDAKRRAADKEKAEKLRQQAEKLIKEAEALENDVEPEPEICGFNEAWVGACQNKRPCPKHKDYVCGVCGKPATYNCEATIGSMVCGSRFCKEHSHSH